MSERNKIYPVYYNTVFGILGIVFGVSLWLLSYNHTDLSIFNLDINGVIAITGIAYGFMNMAVRTICIWLTMWILSRNLYNGGVTINELALTSDFAHGRWYNIMKLTPKRTAIMICCEILLLITEIGYKFGVQSGDSYSVEYNITNGFSHNYYSAGLFRGAACDGENYVLCLTDTAINILTDGVATADLSTLENWGFLQTFIWQESNNVIYSILQRPYINSDTLNQVGPNLTDHNIVAKKLSGLVLSIVRIEVVNARNMNGWSSYGSVVVNCALDFDYTTWNDTISPIGDTIIIDGWSNCIPNHHHMEIRMELCNGTVEWTIEPGQQVQSWNVTNLSNLQCGPIGINTTKGSQVLSSMSAQGGLYGLDHRLFSLTLIDAADASQTGKSTLGVDVVGWNLSRIYVYQRIQVA
ncbi:27841_t:CDS:1, partial [Dentiscutata erythropus]